MRLRKQYLEAISTQAASLSLSNITRFYYNYVRENYSKVRDQIERSGYYVLKNKVSTGSSSTNTKDIYIATYFIDISRAEECNMMLQQKYHTNADVEDTGGFFMPSTNELVVIVKVYDLDDIEDSIKKSDIRNECSEYDDATGKFIRLFQFEITNIAEEWDDVDEYSETWDDMGGYDALAEAEDSKTYLFSNDNGSILVSCSDLDGYMHEFGKFKSAIEAANAIVKSRDVY